MGRKIRDGNGFFQAQTRPTRFALERRPEQSVALAEHEIKVDGSELFVILTITLIIASYTTPQQVINDGRQALASQIGGDCNGLGRYLEIAIGTFARERESDTDLFSWFVGFGV